MFLRKSLLLCLALLLWFPAVEARAQTTATNMCQRAVRNRIWQLRGDRAPVDFTSANITVTGPNTRIVQGRGRVFAPGDVDEFAYTCNVNVATGAVAVSTQPIQKPGDVIGPGWVPGGSWVGSNAARQCHAAARNRIWALRRDRSPVQFTSTQYYFFQQYVQGVRGHGRVLAPGDIDPFSYNCRVNSTNGRVLYLWLQGGKFRDERTFQER